MSEGYMTSEYLGDEQRSDEDSNSNTCPLSDLDLLHGNTCQPSVLDLLHGNTCPPSVLDLLHAVKFRSFDDVVRHTMEGTNMEGGDYDQRTALHVAAAEGREDIVRYLIDECGVNLLLRDRYGRTAYDDAKYFKKDNIASFLRDKMIEKHGVKHDPHSEPQRGLDQTQNVSQCIHAAFRGDIDSLRRYAANGTDLSRSDYDRRTPLHLAAAEGHFQVVSFLLKECQVNPTVKDRFDRNAIDEARANNHPEVEKLLLEYTDGSLPNAIKNLDPLSIELYVKALKDGVEIPNTIRINVIGNATAGKTTLTRSLLGLPLDKIDQTNGIDVHVHEATVTDEGNWIKQDNGEDLQGIWRIAKISLSNRGSTADLTEISEEDNQVNDVKNALSTTEDEAPVKILDSEGDFHSPIERNISKDNESKILQFDSFIKERHTKVDDDHNTKIINVWDFGGQFIFYATHQLFHSPRAIYLLTLDVTRPLTDVVKDEDLLGINGDTCTMTVQSFCKFWLQSIHSFVGTSDGDPPVILVGTHRDLLRGTYEERHKQAYNYLKTVRALFTGSPTQKHIHEKVFIVDNTIQSDDEFSRLRSFIADLFEEKQSWNLKIPAKWIPLENSLIKKKTLKYMTLEEVCKLDNENVLPIGDKEEIRVFLAYQHAQGTIVYFNVEGLSHFVILDPQWIIDAFRCIITTSSFCKIKSIQCLRQELIAHGILRSQLLDEAWRRAGDQDFFEQKEILLRFLHILGIVARARYFDASTHVTEELDFFIVPSLLEKSINNCWLLFRFENMNTPLAFVFTEGIVSPTLYHHITSALLGKWPVVKEADKPQLFADCGMYQLDEEHIGIIRMTENTIEINVGNISGNPVNNHLSDHIRRFVEMIIKDNLEQFNVKSSQKYKLCVKCDHSLHVQSMRKSFTPHSHLIDIKLVMQQWFPNTLKIMSAYRRSQKITQRELSKLPNAIGLNWELLGISLDVSKIQIDKIKMESPYSTAVQMYHMLNIWYQKAGENATWDILLREMADHYRISIDWDIVRNIIEGIPTEHSMEQ